MLRSILKGLFWFILVAAALLAIYRLAGGDVGSMLINVWNFIYSIIWTVSDWFYKFLSGTL